MKVNDADETAARNAFKRVVKNLAKELGYAYIELPGDLNVDIDLGDER